MKFRAEKDRRRGTELCPKEINSRRVGVHHRHHVRPRLVDLAVNVDLLELRLVGRQGRLAVQIVLDHVGLP
jgi:hypothetical protein